MQTNWQALGAKTRAAARLGWNEYTWNGIADAAHPGRHLAPDAATVPSVLDILRCAQMCVRPAAEYIVERYHPITGSHELDIGVGNRLDNSVGTGKFMSLMKACHAFHPMHVDRETFTADTLAPLTLLRNVTQDMVDAVLAQTDTYMREAAKARMPDDWVGSRRDAATGMRKPRTATPAAAAAAAAAAAGSTSDDEDDDAEFGDDEHPRRRMQRRKFAHGGRNVYKEEDWVCHWWRQQPDGEDGWAMAFKAIVEDISLVRVNSAMVERLWSLYNARHKSSGHTFGPGERERVVKKRFNEVYRSGGL